MSLVESAAPGVRPLRTELLAWYDAHARALPWRVGPMERGRGARPDPYRVWLSEVMLQQTTTSHAAPYYEEFVRRWPRVAALAAAPEAEVMAAWAGLGYYARARNLIACAREVARAGGAFPDTEAGLRALPGFGAYTAAAVAAIAFDRPANVVDGNVERVFARLYAVETPVPAARPELRRCAGEWVTADRPGDWAQALMDLGALICRPRAPACGACPLTSVCRARATGAPEGFPRRLAKSAQVRRFGVAYVLKRGNAIALVRRPASGLLGGMLALPSAPWTPTAYEPAPPWSADWREVGCVEHVFTHFPLTLRVFAAATADEFAEALWTEADDARRSLPSVFAKALALVLDAAPGQSLGSALDEAVGESRGSSVSENATGTSSRASTARPATRRGLKRK